MKDTIFKYLKPTTEFFCCFKANTVLIFDSALTSVGYFPFFNIG